MTKSPAIGPKPALIRLRTIVLIWLGWSVLILAYQAFAPARLPLARPDRATSFSADETGPNRHRGRPYLSGGFLNGNVAWDSEYYLSIALHGYDDPQMRAVAPGSTAEAPKSGPQADHPTWTSLNYAFFPIYPWTMRLLAAPLSVLGLTPISAATLAGMLISLAGTLGALLALADMAETDAPGDDLRAAYYLLIWPAAIFLAQVYTEGLFLGLSFGALAMLRRRRWAAAAILAAFATGTRATGGLLLIPLVWTWLQDGGLGELRRGPRRAAAVKLALSFAPALAYLAWRAAFGAQFRHVEGDYFGRGLLRVADTLRSLADLGDYLTDSGPQAWAYYAVEGLAVIAALAASAALWRRQPALTLYGLAGLGIALTSGAALGFPRYVLAVPALFLAPARWGRNVVFDRLWSLGNILILAVYALAFSADFWAG
jgi:hypothetical protein